MGTTLTGTKPKDTYDSLIKVEDNGPISGTAKYLSDGLGNNLPIAVSTSNVGIGTSAPESTLHVNNLVNTAYDPTNTLSSGQTMRLSNLSTTSGISSNLLFVAQGAGGGNGIGTISGVNTGTGSLALTFATRDSGGSVTERVRIQAGGGISFNGDTAAANALDDYEEGTWTIGVSFGGASVGVTTSSNTGTYTKIGRQVTVNGFLVLTSKGSSTGIAKIAGLPFTIGNGNQFYSTAALRLGGVSFANQFQGYGVPNTTTIELEEITEAGAVTAITNADFANDSNVIISLTYFV